MRGGSRRRVWGVGRGRELCSSKGRGGEVTGAAAAVGPGGVRGQRQRQSHQKLQAKGKIV